MSNLLKVTGRISGDLVVVEGRPRLNGWAMIMCERQEQDTVALANQPIVCDMLRWAIGTSCSRMKGYILMAPQRFMMRLDCMAGQRIIPGTREIRRPCSLGTRIEDQTYVS
jgi:hypothetical protein